MSSVLIEHIINNGEHCFSMKAVGDQVFWGALGFRRDAIAWAAKLKKDLLVVYQNDEEYIDASTLLRITKSIQKDDDNERIREFVKFLRRHGGRTTKRAVST